MGRPDPCAELDRRQDAAGANIAHGRADATSAVDYRASGVVRWAKRKDVPPGSWSAGMLARKPPMLVIVAWPTRPRVVWALITKGERYRAPIIAA